MKASIIILLFPVFCFAQNDADRVYKAINAKRQKLEMGSLIYMNVHQSDVDKRLAVVMETNSPAFPEECDCDSETVLSADSMKELLVAATDPQWLHFRPYVRKITVSIKKTDTKYFTVIRTFQ